MLDIDCITVKTLELIFLEYYLQYNKYYNKTVSVFQIANFIFLVD